MKKQRTRVNVKTEYFSQEYNDPTSDEHSIQLVQKKIVSFKQHPEDDIYQDLNENGGDAVLESIINLKDVKDGTYDMIAYVDQYKLVEIE